MMSTVEPDAAQGAPVALRDRVVDLLDDERAAELVGGKAAPLARAARSGCAVPPGFVVTTRAAGGGLAAIAVEVAARLESLGEGPFAVRSSGAFEDGARRSFAGQLETELDVPRAQVGAAIERCWTSAAALRALRYGGGTCGPVAVIVQRMVPATTAGVAFSADSHTGQRGVVLIEAVRGLGDRLVSGATDPEGWRCTAAGCEKVRAGQSPVLDPDQAEAVARLARSMEVLFGAPQDVEWAFDGAALLLLQTRPITALPAPPVPIPIDVPKGSWDRDDHHAVLSPLGWAWFQPYPEAMGVAFKAIGMPLEGVEAARIGGHLYLRFVTGGGEGDKAPPGWVLWLASRLIPAMRRADRAARRTLDEEAYMDTLAIWEGRWRPSLREELSALFEADPTKLEPHALLARIEEALALSARGLTHHAHLGAAGLMGLGKLVLFVQDRLGWHNDRIFALLTGSSAATTELHRSIEALVRRHLREIEAAGELPRTWSGLAARCPALAGDLLDWLDQNRLRMLHYDPRHASLGERPEYVLSIAEGVVHALRAGEVEALDTRAANDEALREAADRLDPTAYAELDRLLAQARKLHAVRDENGIETVSRPAGLLRHFVLELGRRLVPRIDAAEHAVYLTPEEHGPALRGEIADLHARVEERRGQESWAHQNRGPRSYGPAQGAMPAADPFPDGLRRVFRIMSWMMEIEKTPDEDGTTALRGIGVGTRVVTGPARVVLRPEELAAVRHGEIVVCRITSPEWAIGLGRVAALVTEEGGALSHPAIIARELGVTAVLGAAGALRRVKTGDLLHVDPVAATVTPIQRA